MRRHLATFESPSSTEELARFQQIEVPANGWAEIKVEQIMDRFDMEYRKYNRTATCTIASPAQDSDRATVCITIVEDQLAPGPTATLNCCSCPPVV